MIQRERGRGKLRLTRERVSSLCRSKKQRLFQRFEPLCSDAGKFDPVVYNAATSKVELTESRSGLIQQFEAAPVIPEPYLPAPVR